MKIVSIVGARPNFIKIAPLCWELKSRPAIGHIIIHTGQHYAKNLSDSFFEILKIPQPDINLGIGSFNHGVQTGRIMVALEPVLKEICPDWVITVGDVNSTVAASLVAVKMNLKTAHIEAGVRSFDRTMPEEINRIITDRISDLHFITDEYARQNLLQEGVNASSIRLVGNVMIDVLCNMMPEINLAATWKNYKLKPAEYIVGTFHRPSNVDNPERLRILVEIIRSIAKNWKIIIPLHPRTQKNLSQANYFNYLRELTNVIITEPLDYVSFMSLVKNSMATITDSGGIQAETSWLGIPCLTLRENTEWIITLNLGTNELVGFDSGVVMEKLIQVANGNWKKGEQPPLWDGKTAIRIINDLTTT